MLFIQVKNINKKGDLNDVFKKNRNSIPDLITTPHMQPLEGAIRATKATGKWVARKIGITKNVAASGAATGMTAASSDGADDSAATRTSVRATQNPDLSLLVSSIRGCWYTLLSIIGAGTVTVGGFYIGGASAIYLAQWLGAKIGMEFCGEVLFYMGANGTLFCLVANSKNVRKKLLPQIAPVIDENSKLALEGWIAYTGLALGTMNGMYNGNPNPYPATDKALALFNINPAHLAVASSAATGAAPSAAAAVGIAFGGSVPADASAALINAAGTNNALFAMGPLVTGIRICFNLYW